jgi:hypothetical protein
VCRGGRLIVVRAELIQVLRLPDFDHADAIGTFWAIRRRGPSGSC